MYRNQIKWSISKYIIRYTSYYSLRWSQNYVLRYVHDNLGILSRTVSGADPGGGGAGVHPPYGWGEKKKKKKRKKKGKKKGGGGERNRRTKREPAYSPLSEKKTHKKNVKKNENTSGFISAFVVCQYVLGFTKQLSIKLQSSQIDIAKAYTDIQTVIDVILYRMSEIILNMNSPTYSVTCRECVTGLFPPWWFHDWHCGRCTGIMYLLTALRCIIKGRISYLFSTQSCVNSRRGLGMLPSQPQGPCFWCQHTWTNYLTQSPRIW